jgi:predicted nucleotidyltransferase
MDQQVTEILTQISAQVITYDVTLLWRRRNVGKCKANNVTKIMFIRQMKLKQKHSKYTGIVM